MLISSKNDLFARHAIKGIDDTREKTHFWRGQPGTDKMTSNLMQIPVAMITAVVQAQKLHTLTYPITQKPAKLGNKLEQSKNK
jgi:hypothetical protein